LGHTVSKPVARRALVMLPTRGALAGGSQVDDLCHAPARMGNRIYGRRFAASPSHLRQLRRYRGGRAFRAVMTQLRKHRTSDEVAWHADSSAIHAWLIRSPAKLNTTAYPG